RDQGQSVGTVGVPRGFVVGNSAIPGAVRTFGDHRAANQGVGVVSVSRVESHAQLWVQGNLHAKEIHRITDFFNAAQNDAGHRQRLVGIYHKGKGLWVEAGQEEGSVVRLLQGDGAGYILDHCVVVFGGQFQYAVGVAVAQGLGDRIQVVQMDDDHA